MTILVLCLYNKYLLILDLNGSHVYIIKLQDKPFNITMITNSAVAVSYTLKQCVELFDINTQQKLKSITVHGWCRGITTINNNLALGGSVIWIIDPLTGQVIDTIYIDRKHYWLCSLGDRLYSSGLWSNDVVCCNQSGVKLFTTAFPSLALSITSLCDGSLYVRCDNRTVYHVSSDGKNYRLVTTDGLQNNFICSYNANLRKFVIVTVDCAVRVYHEV